MTTRRHDIDALRVIAFALLILYHTAMAYVADWGFHLKSLHTTPLLQWPMLLLNGWRMSLLFLISGIAIALAAPARPGRFALLRTWRLFLPLLFGMFIVVPIQPYCEGISNGAVEPGFWNFLLRYWQVRPWPEGSFAGWQYGITWNHLWYLAYLWVYTLVLTTLMPLLHSGTVSGLMKRFVQAPSAWLLLLPAALQAAWLIGLDGRYPASNAFFGDWYQHAKYGTVFLLGYLLAREPTFRDRVAELRHVSLLVALLAVGWFFFLRALGQVLPEDAALRAWPQEVWDIQNIVCRSIYLWCMLLTLLGWARVWLDRPFRWLPYCTEAVYPWYMLHQSLIIALLFWLKPLQLGPWWEPLLVLLGTVSGCLLLHELLIRRIAPLRPLFGLRMRARRLREAGREADTAPSMT